MNGVLRQCRTVCRRGSGCAPGRVVAEIRISCGERGLQAPIRRTVQRRVDAIDEREVTKAGYGAKAARQKFGFVLDKNQADFPLQVIQINHTPADIIIVVSFERRPVGRPWVTLAIDIGTRMVNGYQAPPAHPCCCCKRRQPPTSDGSICTSSQPSVHRRRH